MIFILAFILTTDIFDLTSKILSLSVKLCRNPLISYLFKANSIFQLVHFDHFRDLGIFAAYFFVLASPTLSKQN